MIYVRNKSELSNWVNKTLERIATHPDDTVNVETLYLLSRIKKYRGKIPNKKGDKTGKEELVFFYDEREWRFVPPKLTIQDIKISKEDELLVLQDIDKLFFELSDIKYIIIKNESERKVMIDALDKGKNDKKSLNLLKSKILTVQEIEQDF